MNIGEESRTFVFEPLDVEIQPLDRDGEVIPESEPAVNATSEDELVVVPV